MMEVTGNRLDFTFVGDDGIIRNGALPAKSVQVKAAKGVTSIVSPV